MREKGPLLVGDRGVADRQRRRRLRAAVERGTGSACCLPISSRRSRLACSVAVRRYRTPGEFNVILKTLSFVLFLCASSASIASDAERQTLLAEYSKALGMEEMISASNLATESMVAASAERVMNNLRQSGMPNQPSRRSRCSTRR
jgi:hypothetical protein